MSSPPKPTTSGQHLHCSCSLGATTLLCGFHLWLPANLTGNVSFLSGLPVLRPKLTASEILGSLNFPELMALHTLCISPNSDKTHPARQFCESTLSTVAGVCTPFATSAPWNGFLFPHSDSYSSFKEHPRDPSLLPKSTCLPWACPGVQPVAL